MTAKNEYKIKTVSGNVQKVSDKFGKFDYFVE